MPGRSYNKQDYRFGYNTQERSDEIHPNHYTAQFWEYDSRIGRRWNRDPVDFVDISPYATNFNNPIQNTDPNGDCPPGEDCDDVTTQGTADEYLNNIENPQQGDHYSINHSPSFSRAGDIIYKKDKKVYHEGNDYGDAGWYSESSHECINRDWANGQVLAPLSFLGKLPAYTEGAREWNGWGVNADGYLSGNRPVGDLTILLGGGRSKIVNGLRLLGSASKGNAVWTIYRGMKK